MSDANAATARAAEGARQGHLEFQNTIEGVIIRTLGNRLTPELKDELRAAGLDLDRKLLPAYPAGAFHRWVVIAARHLYPDVPDEEAVRRFGRQSVAGLGETMIGKAMKLSLTLIGPRRALARSTRSFRSNNNYTEVTAKELSPTSMELVFNEVYDLPTYYQGVLEGACQLIGAKGCEVKAEPVANTGARFVVSWQD